MIRRGSGIAGIVAAFVATFGDLLLLYVANAAREDFAALPDPPRGTLIVGTYLGALAIPLYGLGYWHAAAGLAPGSPRASRWVFLMGTYGGAVGGIVHGLTGLIIHVERSAGTPGADPLAIVTRYGPYLLPLWSLLAALVLAGSALYALTVARGRTAYPRWMALLNPALLVVGVSAVGSTSVWLRAFLLPAGPNVAHVIFFGATTLLAARKAD